MKDNFSGSKLQYETPQLEIIQMEFEGVIAASGGGSVSDIGNGGTFTSTGPARSYGAAQSSDLEDMINDILTVED